MRTISFAVLFLSLSLVGAPSLLAAEYTITDLGVIEPGNNANSYGEAVNNSGVVVGSSRMQSTGYYHASFAPENGTMQDIGTFGGQNSSAAEINDTGDIVGVSSTGPGQREHAFLYQNNLLIDLGTLSGPSTNYFSRAFAINNAGQIVGLSDKQIDFNTIAIRTFLYENGNMTDLGTNLTPKDINELGQIAGDGKQALLWENGTTTNLGTLGGAESKAEAINDLGQIVGKAEIDPADRHTWHAFLWENGVMQDLGTLGVKNSWAYGINNSGHIVGKSKQINAPICADVEFNCPTDYEEHAFIIRDDGIMTDLNDLVDLSQDGQTWEYLVAAYDISDEGHITGIGKMRYYKPDNDYLFQMRAFLLTPKNEAPLLNSVSDQSMKENETVIFNVTAVDPNDDPVTIELTSGEESWMSFNGTLFTAQPDNGTIGAYDITFTATDDDLESETTAQINVTTPYLAGCSLKGIGNIDNDPGKREDVIWQDNKTGAVEVWCMNGNANFSSLKNQNQTAVIKDSMPPDWKILTTGDFDGDGRRDIFWRHAKTGQMDVWLLDGINDYDNLKARGRVGMIRETMSPSWVLKRKGDFNGDNREDLLWQHIKTGRLLVWLLDGTTHVNILGARGDAAVIRDTMSSSWDILKLGDYNGDGRDDLMWQHKAKGKLMVWLMDGTTHVDNLGKRGDAANIRDSMSFSWGLEKMGDFNADGKDDFLWKHKKTGKLMIWLLDGTTHINTIGKRGDAANISNSSSSSYRILRMDDFNGDGKDDLLWQHKTKGNLNLWLLDGTTHINTLAARGDITAFHPSNISSKWKLRGSGDFDGDGKADLIWIHDNGRVSIWLMDGTTSHNSLVARGDVATIA